MCVAKQAIAAHDRQSAAAFGDATLVLGARRSAFSTDAVNHDLIALPICCGLRELFTRADGINKKIQQELGKEVLEETPTTNTQARKRDVTQD
ncbi:hypothetical protein, partial [Bradyrhizobium genomosp. III]|uniref:hypothetical protein n=1 Tax=Bradyrhizobium genomosp. III TaxID=2683271 RepID=UPI001AEC0920